MTTVKRHVLLIVAIALLSLVWATKPQPGTGSSPGAPGIEPTRVCQEYFYHSYSYCTDTDCYLDTGCSINPWTPDGQVWGYYTVVKVTRICYYDCETGALYSCDEDVDISQTWAECGGCCPI